MTYIPNEGYPATTVDGETVTIVSKDLDANEQTEVFTDSEGKKYTRSINGSQAQYLVAIEEATEAVEVESTEELDADEA